MANFFKEEQGTPLSKSDMLRLDFTDRFIDGDDREIVQIDDMLFAVSDLARDGFTGTRWTDGKVYYTFDDNVSNKNRTRFIEACRAWSDVADLEFAARTSEPNYIHVQTSHMNASYVGMIGGRQDLYMYNWNWRLIIAHELGHALGLAHEHQRADRDRYVRINFQNVQPGAENNFEILDTASHSRYDFSSIMHYDSHAFSKNGLPTIEAQPGYEDQEQHMGNRSYMTAHDAADMAIRYGAPTLVVPQS